MILFFILDLGGNGSEGKIPRLGNVLNICLFSDHVSSSMLISFMLIKKRSKLSPRKESNSK